MLKKVDKKYREQFLYFGRALAQNGISMITEDEIKHLQQALEDKKIPPSPQGNEILWLEFLGRGFYAEAYEEPPQEENVVNFRRRTSKNEEEIPIPRLVRLKQKLVSPNFSQQPTPSSEKKTKFCRGCRAQYVVGEQSFCIQCGQKLSPQPGVLQCPRCDNPHQGNHVFCGVCGFRFTIPTTLPRCGNCGNPMKQGQNFCGCCGVKFLI